MPPRRPVSGRSQSPRARYAEELATLRRARGISLRALGEEVCADHSHLGHMEHGTTLGGPELAQALDAFYGTTHLVVLWELAVRDPSQFRERYRRYMTLEAEATGLQQYAPSVVPGLLQTAAYAGALINEASPATPEDLTEQVEARLGRQELLTRAEQPQFRAIIDEAALRRPLLDPGDWREQLSQLLETAQRSSVTIQVLPFTSGLHSLVSTDLMLLRLSDGSSIAYTETANSGELTEEPGGVERMRVAYDRVRDLALSPRESLAFLTQAMEDSPTCEARSLT